MHGESRIVKLIVGVLALVAAIAIGWAQAAAGVWPRITTMFAVGCAAFGAFLLFGTGKTVRHPGVGTIADEPIVALSDDELERRLTGDPLPLGLCTKCRVLDAPPAFHGRCPRCDAGADYLVIEQEPERTLARSALS